MAQDLARNPLSNKSSKQMAAKWICKIKLYAPLLNSDRYAFLRGYMDSNDFGVKPGEIIHVYSQSETSEIDAVWVNAYCKDKQGANIKDYRWHIFSFEKFPSISGNSALEKYKEQEASKYIILSNDGEPALVTNKLPFECEFRDFLVFPKNMAWTMAFTHEDGWLGPYFAQHKNYEKLVKYNEQEVQREIKKQKEVRNAKEKGWL